ncbi:amino acid adenylation domain-containing protein [Streptomyces sp. B1I3]|nr:amino acid adenylation domain-containing protein [Streptomyces sp. B1I3]
MTESFIDFFEAHVAATPDATAIVSTTGALSYHELDALARRQARELTDREVRPGALVGVCAEPGPAMIAAILGVLKAGAAYVPLDPEYPEQRLDYLVQDSGMSAVLAEEHLAPRLSGRGLPVIGVPNSAGAGSAPAFETVRRGPDDLVYVIYTSGSTGRPKGVRVTEANVVNLLNAVGEGYKLSEGDVTIFTHSFTFDASVLEIFAPLAFGAKLVVAAADERRDAAKLVAAVKRHGVTIWDMVPAMLAQVVDLPDFAADCASLRLAISGADVLPPGLAHRFLTLAPWCELQNQYGPTEATVITTVWSCTTDTAAGPVPIGFPIAGTSVHVLDERLAPVVPGEIGEIHIGGAGVTAGYHGRPELTAERFVTGPDGARLYRTGDLGRLRADGALEFHGRADRQLAVRGFRVEPGEIEDALCTDPAVQNAAVVTRGSGNDVLLIAYVTASADQSLLVPALRKRVGEVLPEHLRPNGYVVLDELPLGVSGKVDHRALPAPPSTRPELSVPYVAPGDRDEQKVATTVAQILGLDDIGVDDNFFELGAHSLLATKIITRVRAEFQTDVPVSVVFEHPTVAGLVGWLRVNADAATKVQGPPRADRTGPIPLSLPQEQVWFLGKLVPDSIAYATQAYLDLRGPVSVAVLEESLGEIVRRHELLRTTFVEGADGIPEQIIHPAYPVSVQVEDLSGEPEEIREILALDRMQTIVARPFDVGRLPLFRWVLFRLSADHHMLLLVEHHELATFVAGDAAVDGFGVDVQCHVDPEGQHRRPGGRQSADPLARAADHQQVGRGPVRRAEHLPPRGRLSVRDGDRAHLGRHLVSQVGQEVGHPLRTALVRQREPALGRAEDLVREAASGKVRPALPDPRPAPGAGGPPVPRPDRERYGGHQGVRAFAAAKTTCRSCSASAIPRSRPSGMGVKSWTPYEPDPCTTTSSVSSRPRSMPVRAPVRAITSDHSRSSRGSAGRSTAVPASSARISAYRERHSYSETTTPPPPCVRISWFIAGEVAGRRV